MRRSNWIGSLAIVIALAACQPAPQLITSAYNATQVILTEPPAVTVTSLLPVNTIPQSPASSTPAVYPGPTAIPQPYPGQTLVPTLDPTRVEGTRQAENATSTADTALRRQTATAEEAAPTSASVPTNTPPVPTPVIIDSTPDCVPGDPYAHCHDTVLTIAFEYPAAWGAISAQRYSGDTGFGYQYQFSRGTYYPKAAGLSLDFTQGRDRWIMDFQGFGPDSRIRPEDNLSYGAVITRDVQTRVRLAFIFPAAVYVCNPDHGPGAVVEPLGLVAIDLPHNPNVNGFLFVSNILPVAQWHALADVLGLQDQTQAIKCQDANRRQQFDAKVASLAAVIRAGTADPATQANIDQLIHLAKSIRFD